MYTLYWSQDSGALAPQMLLQEAGADYRRIVLDLKAGDHKKDDYLAVNPKGQVPTLILADGSILTESGSTTCAKR